LIVAWGKSVPRPFRQSDLDKTCGIVSVVNAMRICVGSVVLGTKESTDLFSDGAGYLLRRGFLKGILRAGMDDAVHNHLIHFLCRVIEKKYSIRLQVQRPYRKGKRKRARTIPISLIAAHLRQFLAVRGRAALISLETKEFAHFSVIRSVSKSSFLLSDGERTRLPLKACSTSLSAHYKYFIDIEAVVLMSVMNPNRR